MLVAPAVTEEEPVDVNPQADHDANRRRFTIAVLIGVAVSAPLYLWVLWGGHLDPLRSYFPNNAFANFYEIQARALFHGHWYVPTGSLSIEAFVHDGRSYMYFGPFPSLLRMPILLFTSRLDGRLTAVSLLIAWMCTALFASLLLWRVRILIRGSMILGRAEAASYGALIAALLAGSVLMFMGAIPYVYNEDLAWGATLTIGSMFGLLGILERPTGYRVIGTGALILAANLSRLPLGWACVIGAILAALWFHLGYGGEDNRRWRLPVLACGLIPLAVGCYVTWAKFGTPFGLPMADQVWTQISAHRRLFLAVNGGKAYNLAFVPTNALAYLGPAGLSFTSVFPFITLPSSPPTVIGNVVFDMTYRTASAPASMPLLFLLACAGTFAAFRRRASGQARLIRIPLLAAASGTVGVLVWGYIANRYLSDFLPFLFLASCVGLVDVWHRVKVRRRRARKRILVAVCLLAALSIAINLGIASTPADSSAWQGARVQNYVHLQESISSFTGNPIAGNVLRGSTLPSWEPADTLFVLDHCAALYISNGEHYSTWIPVTYGPGVLHLVSVTLRNRSTSGSIPLLTIGRNLKDTVLLQYRRGQVRFQLEDPLYPVLSSWIPLDPGHAHQVSLIADSSLQNLTISVNGQTVLTSTVSTGETVSKVVATPSSAARDSSVAVAQLPVAIPALCRPLDSGH